MKSARSRWIPWLVSGLLAAAGILPSLAHAGGPGGRCFPHGRRLRTPTAQVAGTSVLLTGQPMAPMGVTTWWVQADACAGTNSGRLPVSLVPAVVVPSPTMLGIPTYAYVLVGSPPAAPDLGLGETAAPAPRPPAGASGSPQAPDASGTDTLDRPSAGAAAGSPPIPARDDRPAGLPAPPSGELRVRVTFENEPPGAPEPAASRDALDSIESVAKGLGGTVLSRDATGIKIRKSDGGIVQFGPDGRIKPY